MIIKSIRKEVERRLRELPADKFRQAVRFAVSNAIGEGRQKEAELAQLLSAFNRDDNTRRHVCDELELPTPEEYPALLAAESVDTSKKSADAAEKSADAAQASAATAQEAINLGERRFMQATWNNAISLGSAFVALVALAVALLK